MTEAFIGIDVAFAKGKHLPIAVCTRSGNRLVPLRLRGAGLPQPPIGRGNAAVLDPLAVASFAEETAQYVLDVCARFGVTPTTIAIDAPSAPRREGESRRAAEKALSEAGISAFSTPSRSETDHMLKAVRGHLDAKLAEANLPYANKLWMMAGFALFDRLAQVATCIEVYPNAIARALGCTLHKSKSGGVQAQLCAAAKHTGWPDQVHSATEFADIAWGPDNHDRLDAYLSAWVASLTPLRESQLPRAGQRWAYGDPEVGDAIWVPVLTTPAAFPHASHPVYSTSQATPTSKVANSVTPKSPASPAFSRVCPACGDKTFAQWPSGWDGHAAYRCSGLTSDSPEARKQEYRGRFGHLFKDKASGRSSTESRQDVAAFEARAAEPDIPFENVVADLRARDKL